MGNTQMNLWGTAIVTVLGAGVGYYVNGPTSAAIGAITAAILAESSRRKRLEREAARERS
ncbi:hypothetical protein [Arthrobacter woluwensis]|uniref:hypothetical protein n=2 Tax=Arthrobacter woluwensis TaxID=156980 RepID=UPI001AAFC236|nr:hypothetical protein [Arthrobacter woluwensis]QTF71827.1 hypothetical protein G8758_07300 [Arthrobacter woluwensis]